MAVGDVKRSLAVGAVEGSRHATFQAGDRLYGWFGRQDYCRATPEPVIARVDPNNGSEIAALGVLGISSVSAYLALTEIGAPRKGETVVISTAAGAVGSVVGQLAGQLGCHVVGITGSQTKVARCLKDYGYHAALNYKAGLRASDVTAICPRGVDVFFDNTSGVIADAVWPLMNVRGRVIQCGTTAVATWDPPPTAERRERNVLTKRLRHEGFVIFDHLARFATVGRELAALIKSGALVYRQDIDLGLDQAPRALAELYEGGISERRSFSWNPLSKARQACEREAASQVD